MPKKELKSLTFKDTLKSLKEAKYGFSSHLLYFILSTILSLCIAYIEPYSLFLSVPFVIVPSYFAFTSLNAIKGAKFSEDATFLKLFKSYFSNFFFGGYRLLIGFLKAFIGYLLVNLITFTIFDYTIFKKFDTYNQIVEKVQASGEINSVVQELSNFLANDPEIQKYMIIVSSISAIFGMLIFIHHIAKESIKMKRNLFIKQTIPLRQYHFVDKRVQHLYRKDLFNWYIRTCWFIQLLIVLASVGGFFISYFFLKEFNAGQSFVISLFLMFIVSIPFLNYISVVQKNIYVNLMGVYEEVFARMTLEFLTKYKEKIGIAEEDAKKIEEILNNDYVTKKDDKNEEDHIDDK